MDALTVSTDRLHCKQSRDALSLLVFARPLLLDFGPVGPNRKTIRCARILALILFVGTGFSQSGLPVTYDRLLKADQEPGNWLMYSGNYRSHRFGSLTEINRENVRRLHPKWIFQEHHPRVEATPLVVDGIMYTVRVPNDVLALDAETGRILWTYVHRVPPGIVSCCGQVNRELAIQGSRLFMETLDAKLLALDARSGRLLWKSGIADYTQGYAGTAAPLVAKDKVIVGISGGEYGIRGFLDAYYVATGERAWRLYTIPGKGEPGQRNLGRRFLETRRRLHVDHGILRSGTEPGLLGCRQPWSRHEWGCSKGR